MSTITAAAWSVLARRYSYIINSNDLTPDAKAGYLAAACMVDDSIPTTGAERVADLVRDIRTRLPNDVSDRDE